MSNIKVTQDQIQDIIANSEIKVWTMYDKVTMVVSKRPNGFVVCNFNITHIVSSY